MASVRQTVFEFLDNLEGGAIVSGWQIYEHCESVTGRHTYPTTLLNYCRQYADISGAEFVCVDFEKSKYKFTPGFTKLSGLSLGRE